MPGTEVGERPATPALELRPVPAAESAALGAGSWVQPAGVSWAEGYPTSDTVTAVRMLADTYAALGLPVRDPLPWWVYQITVAALGGRTRTVVGDIGFHGPPDVDGAVEIGYCVVPSWRRRGIATAACRQLVDLARELGAISIHADAAVDNPASQAVLRSAGFTWLGDSRFVSTRVDP